MGRFRLYYKKRKLGIIEGGRQFIKKLGGNYKDYNLFSKLKTGSKKRYGRFQLMRLADKK